METELDQAVCMGRVLNGALQELHARAQEACEIARRRVVQIEEVRSLWRQTPREVRQRYGVGYGALLSETWRASRQQASKEQRDLAAFEVNPSKWLALELCLIPVAGWDFPIAATVEHGSHAGVIRLIVAEG